ncbi:hypothetical protein ACQE98_07945 [Ornithinimicrobium sp. W1679]|uniref:hypothetical protein n=1 Tax=Ornithinimicrobium sp. W1679 TaxID=3418770 RepID=UPI003CFAAF37
MDRPGRGGGSPRARGWSPRWAVVVSVVGALATLPVLVLALTLIADDLGSTGEKFDGLGLALGGLALVPVALVLLPFAWFWARGGRPAFWVGVAAALVLAVLTLLEGFRIS